MPPTIAIKATNPPATPPAIAATLDLDSGLESCEAAALGVKTTVRVTTTPLSVTKVGIVTGCSVGVGELLGVGVVEDFWLCMSC